MGMFVNPGNQAFQVAVNSEIYKSRVGKPICFNRGLKAKKLLQLSDNDVEFCRNVVYGNCSFCACVLVCCMIYCLYQ